MIIDYSKPIMIAGAMTFPDVVFGDQAENTRNVAYVEGDDDRVEDVTGEPEQEQ